MTNYYEEKTNFLRKHNEKCECRVFTSPMINNRYHKEYCWEDGAEWFEISELITEKKKVEAHGLTFEVEIEVWRTEYWNTDDSGSKYFYEK